MCQQSAGPWFIMFTHIMMNNENMDYTLQLVIDVSMSSDQRTTASDRCDETSQLSYICHRT